MSVRVIRATLSAAEQKALIAALKLQARVKPRREAGREIFPIPPPPINFFKIVDEYVDVPLATARALRVGPYARDAAVRARHARAPHPRVPPERAQFVVDLLPKQTDVQPMRVRMTDKDPSNHSPSELMRRQLELAPALQSDAAAAIGPLGEGAGTCVFGMYPGFGKTACAAHEIVHAGYVALVVVQREHLITQWQATFANFTRLNAVAWTSAAARRKNKPDVANADVVISMDTCVDKLPKEFLDAVGILVLDEAHLLCTPTRKDLFFITKPMHVIACSATLAREDGMHTMITRTAGETGVFIDSPVHFDLYRVNTPFVPSTGDGGNLDWGAVLASLASMPERNAFVYDLVTRLVRERGRKVLLMTSRVAHAETLADELAAHAAGHFTVASFYGAKRSYRDAHVLVASLSKAGTGFDEVYACEDWGGTKIDTLVLLTSIATFPTMVQTFGRAFRSERPEVYYFVDRLGTIANHFRAAARFAAEKVGKENKPRGRVFIYKSNDQDEEAEE